ncbi:MAG: hypothetical protein ACT4NV_17955 [Rhodoferax sp.]
MIVEFNLTNIIFVVVALFSGVWAIAKFFLEKIEKSQDARHKVLAELLQANQETTLQLERDFLKFQTEIPRTYLRRDDYVREVQQLHEAIQRDLLPIRTSVSRIEDFLMQK